MFERFFDLHRLPHQHAFFVVANDHTSATTLELLAERFIDPKKTRNYSEALLQSCCGDILGHPNCPDRLAAALRGALGADYTPHQRHRFGPSPWRFPTPEQMTAAAKAATRALAGDDVKARAAAAADPATPAAALTATAPPASGRP